MQNIGGSMSRAEDLNKREVSCAHVGYVNNDHIIFIQRAENRDFDCIRIPDGQISIEHNGRRVGGGKIRSVGQELPPYFTNL
jgi:hypothetical protein